MTVKEISDTAGLSAPAQALVREDSTPASYLDSLEKEKLYQDALKFLAHKMPVDAGVKWACASIRELQSPEKKQQKNQPLEASEQWTKTPGDQTRWAAKKAADNSDMRGPAKLVANAVFLSGGSIAGPGAPEIPPPRGAAQKLIAGSVQIAVVSYTPEKSDERYKRAIAMGKTFDQPSPA
jgi:hypothetical protein